MSSNVMTWPHFAHIAGYVKFFTYKVLFLVTVFRYGTSLVDAHLAEKSLKLETVKGLKVLGFTNVDNVSKCFR